MDFGLVGLDGLVVSDTGFASDPEIKQKMYGFGCLKHERSGTNEDDWRDLKLNKTSDDFSASKAMSSLLRSNSSFLSDGQQMLSFSYPNSQPETSHYYYPHTSSAYNSRNTGYVSGGLNSVSMHGVLRGVKGPFTSSQWMELEHQALIYKYITANVPIPSNLLIPIKKALDSAGLSNFSGLRSNTWGWGSFHLGFSNNNDPEPGRCRRTDGKKWRCSRDAVANQKYCERHMNRGRHRSRKPVEGQTGHSVPGPTSITTNKLMPMASSTSASVVLGGGTSNSLSHHHKLSNLQPGAANPSPSPNPSRSFLNKENMGDKIQDTTGLSMLTPSIGLKENQHSIPKLQSPYEELSRAEFGFVSTDSLLNPLNKSSSLINCRNYGSSENPNDHESKSQNALRQFMDDWPKSVSECSGISWPGIGLQTDRTQLSISIPIASSDFMSATSSPNNEKLVLSPLSLSRELEPTQRNLGADMVLNEPNQRRANWIPISWENSMGGPLGEVLHSTSNSTSDCKNTSVLNLMTEGWDSSPSLASSPTGVLQKSVFGSLSNSSAGSSPRAEGASLCNGLLGSTLMNPSLPNL